MSRDMRLLCRPRVRQHGMMMIEFLASLMVGSLMLAGIVGFVSWYLDMIKLNSAADYQSRVAKAAQSYIKDNYGDLSAELKKGSPLSIKLKEMQNSGYGNNLAPSNIFGSTPCLLIGERADKPGQVVALLVLEGGDAIPEADLAMAASLSGSSGGFIPDKNALALAKAKFTDSGSLSTEAGYKNILTKEWVTTDVAYGPFSAWALSTRHFADTHCSSRDFKAHLASLIPVDTSAADPDFISRTSGGAASSMKTDLDMNNHDILGVNNLSVTYPLMTRAKDPDKFGTCENGKIPDGSVFYDKEKKGLVMCNGKAGSVLAGANSELVQLVSTYGTLKWVTAKSGGSSKDLYCAPNEILVYARSTCSTTGSTIFSRGDYLYPKIFDGPVVKKRLLIAKSDYAFGFVSGPGVIGASAMINTTKEVGAGACGQNTSLCTWGVSKDYIINEEINSVTNPNPATMGVIYGYVNGEFDAANPDAKATAALVKGIYIEGWKVQCHDEQRVVAWLGIACRAIGATLQDTSIEIDAINTTNSYTPGDKSMNDYMPKPFGNVITPQAALPHYGIRLKGKDE